MAIDKPQFAVRMPVNPLKIKVDLSNRSLFIDYTPKTNRAMFDVCDPDGRIVQTGVVEEGGVNVELNDQFSAGSRYLLWVVDGDEIVKSQFLFS